jgi:hypothetical protein
MANENLIASALLKTDPALYSQVDGGGDWLAAIRKKGARVKLYRAYERGDQRSNLTTQQKKLLNIRESNEELNEFNSNYCGIIVDAMAARLAVSEITADDEDVTTWIQDTLNRNGFEQKQGEWFRGAIRDSESFVIVDPQTALWASESAFDGYSGVVAIYNPMTGLPMWACKLWIIAEPSDVSSDAEDLGDEDVVNIVVYQPDKISHWRGQAGGGEVEASIISRTEDSATNEMPWDLGVIPMAHYANKRDNYTTAGESEIRSVVPLQDILNSTLYDMQMASKLSAFKVYWSKGLEIDKDGIVPGSVINLLLKDESGNVATSLDEAAARFLAAVEVGEFGTTDMSQYTNQIDKLEREISQISSTPVYGITTQGALSGDALKQLETGLIGKVHRFQHENTVAIEMLLKLTAEIQRTFNVNQSFGEKIKSQVAQFLGLSAPSQPPQSLDGISINWKSPEIVDVSKQLTSLSQLRRDNPGLWPDEWYREKIGSLLGMKSDQIKAEGVKAQEQQISVFDRLVGGGGNVPPV